MSRKLSTFCLLSAFSAGCSSGGTTQGATESKTSTEPDAAATAPPDSGSRALPPGVTALGDDEMLLETEHVAVAPGQEVFKCQDFKNPFGKDIAVTVTSSEMTKGSHHLFTFMMPNEELELVGDVDCPQGGFEFHDFMHASQTPEMVIPYPEGMGRFLAKGTGFRLMLHLLNVTDETLDGFVKFKMKYVDPSQVEKRAASMFLNYVGIQVPPGKSTTNVEYEMPYDIFMIGALSHMHRRGVHFKAWVDGGPQLFETDDWLEPVPRVIDPPIAISKGTKIKWSCDFENDTGKTLAFGESAATNEMCIFPGTFYGGDGSGIVPLIP